MRRRLTYANIMSTIAVVIAVAGGGTAFALTVTSADIVNGAVTSADIQNGGIRSIDVGTSALTGANVRNGSIQAGDFSTAARRMLDDVTASATILRRASDTNQNATLVGPSAVNVVGVSRPAVGTYCIRVKPGVYRGNGSGDKVLTTVEWGSSTTHTLAAYWNRSQTGCVNDEDDPLPNTIEVRTRDSATGAATNNVSFSVIVVRGTA